MAGKKHTHSTFTKLAKTSVQLSEDSLRWLDRWSAELGITRSEAIRLALERTEFLCYEGTTKRKHVESVAREYDSVLTLAFEGFTSYRHFRAVTSRMFLAVIKTSIEDVEELTGTNPDPDGRLFKTIEALDASQRIVLFDCVMKSRPSSGKMDY